ncbi:MAG: alpha/beta fold hydrolase [Novosphingobium sp.]
MPKLVLLHGWPSSSRQQRDLIPALSKRFHVIAPESYTSDAASVAGLTNLRIQLDLFYD